MPELLGHMYVGRRPCGCVSAYSWDDPGYEKDTAKFVARIIKRGDTIERIKRFKGDPMIEMSCAEHAAAEARGAA